MKKKNRYNNISNAILNAVKNLGNTRLMHTRSFAPLRMTRTGAGMAILMMALAFTACTKEDLMPPTQGDAGTLHITSVTIDGQQVARTRVVADDRKYDMGELPFNQSIIGFTAGDVLTLHCRFDDNVSYTPKVHATFGADGTWQLTNSYTNAPITLAPDRENGKKWADVFMSADFFSGTSLEGEDALNKAKELGAVQGKAIATENIHLLTDYLVATTSLTNQDTQGFGSITIDTDLKSPTLGAVTIQLKHTYRALLRLPKSAAANVTRGTYIVDGTAHNVTGLGTLWAEVQYGSSTYYYPLTEVGDYLQAIVVADLPDQMPGNATLTGFKAVMLTEESGIVGSDSFDETKTLTLDLPFKKGASTTVSTSIYLLPNYRYPLTLNIAPHTASVTLTDGLGKPGWGTDEEEEELSNEMNELLITVDGTQYIKLDGTATEVDKVKSIIEAATAAGYTNFYVTGATLAAYSNGTAKSVVGEAIRLLTTDAEGKTVSDSPYRGTISLVLPNATGITQSAFRNCEALKSVSAPKATSIGDHAFRNCKALTDVSLDTATTIGIYAFYSCEALANVDLPVATSIGDYAFNSCEALTSLTFGAVIVSVGENVSYHSTICALTLAEGQEHMTQANMYTPGSPTGTPVTAADESATEEDRTWAGMVWKSITIKNATE